jgi:hypothetical protein
LKLFPSAELPSLTPVCTRFHSLISRILHRRLVDLAALPDYELLLECYHPSLQVSTPSLSCRYLGPKSWDGRAIDESSPAADLQKHYSSFQPIVRDDTSGRGPPWASTPPSQVSADPELETATEDIYLDDGELFSQLCVSTSVIRQGPRRGLLASHVSVSDGVVRVFRAWLRRIADAAASGALPPAKPPCDDEDILWVDTAKTVGLRFKIRLGPMDRMPVLTGPDDEPPVTYTLIYQELLIRTSKLLSAVERSTSEEVAHSGKAIIIAGL